MRVLIVSDATGYMVGGVATETIHLVRGLVARGHDVALAGDVIPAGAEFARHLPLTVPVGPRLVHEVRHALEVHRPDVVHVMMMSSPGILKIAPLLKSTPWVFTCHSLPPLERKLHALHGNDALHYAARWARFLPHAAAWRWIFRRGVVPQAVVHSGVMRDVVTRYGQRADACRLIPLGCEMSAWNDGVPRSPCGPAPRLVTMAGLAHTKGQHDAIAAIASLRNEFPDLTYQLIGEIRDRSYGQHLEHLIDRHGLRGQVHITPNLSNEAKERALREADAYLQPSHEEGFCLAYIEAAGRVGRLVGTDTGAIAAIGAGDPGMRTVPVRSPKRLEEALREVLRAPLPADLMAQRRARLDHAFGWDRYLDAHEAMYRRDHHVGGHAARAPARVDTARVRPSRS